MKARCPTERPRAGRTPAQLLAIGALISPVLPGPAALAQSPPWSFSASAALATRYVSRGLDLTDGPLSPSVSAELRSGPEAAWYASTAVTALDYFHIDSEIDGGLGHRGARGSLRYDLGVYYYWYPGPAGAATHASFGETGAHLAWGSGRLVPVLDVYVSPDYFFGSGPGIYADAGADATLPAGVTLGFRYGYTHVKDLAAFQYPNYRNWILTALRSFGPWDLSLQLTDTSIDRHQCLDEPRCSLKFSLRVARNFGPS